MSGIPKNLLFVAQKQTREGEQWQQQLARWRCANEMYKINMSTCQRSGPAEEKELQVQQADRMVHDMCPAGIEPEIPECVT